MCADTLSRCFSDMKDSDKQEFLPGATKVKKDFIVSGNAADEEAQGISFYDDGETGNNEPVYL